MMSTVARSVMFETSKTMRPTGSEGAKKKKGTWLMKTPSWPASVEKKVSRVLALFLVV
jgi:hypothetical protein